jgi:hypothetical protein
VISEIILIFVGTLSIYFKKIIILRQQWPPGLEGPVKSLPIENPPLFCFIIGKQTGSLMDNIELRLELSSGAFMVKA